ncbi:MAG: FlgD immunoglobulin-like domain containing protein, partial [Flavobacteriales bacterium]
TWSAADMGITAASNWWLASEQGMLFCGTEFGPSFRSTDDGDTWEDIGQIGVRGFVEHNDTLYACFWYEDQVRYSADGGTTWQNTAVINAAYLWPMISVGGSLLVGGQGGGLRRIVNSSDAWVWSNTGLTSTEIYALTLHDGTLFAGTGNLNLNGGVHRSEDLGVSWTACGMHGITIYALHVFNGVLYAGTANNGVYRSSDLGATWEPFSGGLMHHTVMRLTDDGSHLYAGTLQGLHRYDLSTGLSAPAVMTMRAHVYPVPCHDLLTTEVLLDKVAHLHLRLHDVTGRVVAEQVAGERPAGAHHFTWDMTDLAPGSYLCQVTAGEERSAVRVVRE